MTDNATYLWVTLYDNVAVQLIGKTAQEMKDLRDAGYERELTEIIKSIYMKDIKMSICSKLEKYNGESKIRHQVMKASFYNPNEEVDDRPFV